MKPGYSFIQTVFLVKLAGKTEDEYMHDARHQMHESFNQSYMKSKYNLNTDSCSVELNPPYLNNDYVVVRFIVLLEHK